MVGFSKGFLRSLLAFCPPPPIEIHFSFLFFYFWIKRTRNEKNFDRKNHVIWCYILWRWAYCQRSSVGFSLRNPRETCTSNHALLVLPSLSFSTLFRSRFLFNANYKWKKPKRERRKMRLPSLALNQEKQNSR
ncbi:hypothetical protein CDL12_18785 [Handroanthus impetiginosus]|uniref:Uncharacterized protein n=1 Tax=Handroanthus impetiginosus TaxID=429701 RepID=A0A2G9GTL4_9LAMI|nr:hypothetical protein CDL12_18785 [Handroanthus impetiginosus]